jgi:hypothetical protein
MPSFPRVPILRVLPTPSIASRVTITSRCSTNEPLYGSDNRRTVRCSRTKLSRARPLAVH